MALKITERESLPYGQSWEQFTPLFMEWEVDQGENINKLLRSAQWPGQLVMDLERKRNRRSETRSPGVGAWGWTWEWAQSVKSFLSHFDATRKHSVWKSHRKPSRQNDLARQCYPAFAISHPGCGPVSTLLARSLWQRWMLCLDPTEGTPFVLVYLDTDASECPNCHQQKPTLSTILWWIYFRSKEITSWKE